MGHLGAEELRRVQRGLVDHHGHALDIHALHDALDGTRAEVVRVRLHRHVVDARVHQLPYFKLREFADKKLQAKIGMIVK